MRVSVLEPRAWEEVCKVIESPEIVLDELRARHGRATVLDEEIERARATLKPSTRKTSPPHACSPSPKPMRQTSSASSPASTSCTCKPAPG
jgi:hypothetical protein